jgi:hypothetical protein
VSLVPRHLRSISESARRSDERDTGILAEAETSIAISYIP